VEDAVSASLHAAEELTRTASRVAHGVAL